MALVLAGDNNFEDLLFLKEFLQASGHELRLANSCDMVSELIHAETVEILILSLDMLIEENSFPLLGDIFAQNPRSAVILVTSQPWKESLPIEDLSRYVLLSRPLDLDKLKEILAQLV
jgi:DNA-binding NtrC family response regulator